MIKDKLMGITLAAVAVGVIAVAVFSPIPKAKTAYASGNDMTPLEEANAAQAARDAQAAAVQEQRNKELEEFVAQSVPENKTVYIDGQKTESKYDGLYLAKEVAGVSVGSSEGADLASELGASANEKAYVTTWDVTKSKSPAAIATVNAAAETVNAVVGPTIQLNIGKKTKDGIDYSNQDAKVLTTVGIPPRFYAPDVKYGVIRVVPGGQFEILPDLGTDGHSVSFEATSGEATYTIVILDLPENIQVTSY